MHGVGKDNDVSLRRRIDPQRRAGKPGVPVRANGQEVTAIGRKRRIDVPAEGADRGQRRRRLRRGHFLDRERRQDGSAAIQHGLRVLGNVVGGGEQAGVSGDSAHAARGGIVHDAAQHGAALVLPFERQVERHSGLYVLRGRDFRQPLLGRQEARVRHVQRFINMRQRVLVERHAGNAVHQLAQHFEINVAIQEARARGINRRFVVCHLERGVVSLPRLLQVEVLAQAGSMRKKLSEGDLLLAVGAEFRDVLRHRIVQANLAQLHHAHD